jgi:hypothetical protein
MTAQAVAQPEITVTPSNAVNANGNRVWTIRIVPDDDDLPSSLGAELAFTMTPGVATQPMAIIDNTANDSNVQAASSANDTWYYQTTDGAAYTVGVNGLWVADDTNPNNQNIGLNPFTTTETEGLYTAGANVFAALGSIVFPDPTATVNTLQIVTDGGGGILSLDGGTIAQLDEDFEIDPELFYVPADWDGNGTVSSTDFNLLLSFFGVAAGPAWDGFQPVNPIVSSADFNLLLQNFGAGTAFGAGAGDIAGGMAVPEPTSVALLCIGSLFVGFMLRRGRQQ